MFHVEHRRKPSVASGQGDAGGTGFGGRAWPGPELPAGLGRHQHGQHQVERDQQADRDPERPEQPDGQADRGRAEP
jgi:hypothetical protein